MRILTEFPRNMVSPGMFQERLVHIEGIVDSVGEMGERVEEGGVGGGRERRERRGGEIINGPRRSAILATSLFVRRKHITHVR